MSKILHDFKVGDGVSVSIACDSSPATVTRITPARVFVKYDRMIVTEPESHYGAQNGEYRYERWPEAAEMKFTVRTDGRVFMTGGRTFSLSHGRAYRRDPHI